MLYATYLGGASEDWANRISVDGRGQAYVTGAAPSNNFPVTTGVFAFQTAGASDAFIAKLSFSDTPFCAGETSTSGINVSAAATGAAEARGITSSN